MWMFSWFCGARHPVPAQRGALEDGDKSHPQHPAAFSQSLRYRHHHGDRLEERADSDAEHLKAFDERAAVLQLWTTES